MNPSIQFKLLARRRGLPLRGLLCWAIGWLILTSDEISSFDTRFQLRGQQSISEKIVLITVRSSDLEKIYHIRSSNLISLKEVTEVSDSFYWDKFVWADILNKLLEKKPQKIGISFYFAPYLNRSNLEKDDFKIFTDKRILWATSTINTLHRDEDGVIRRFLTTENAPSHLTEILAEKKMDPLRSRLINFRGPDGRFPQFYLEDLLKDKIPTKFLQDKILIIGPESNASTPLTTPLGTMKRAEILANIVDNLMENRWILRLPILMYAFLLFLLMVLCIFLITQYPQSVVLMFLLGIATFSAALSTWVFDLYYLWTPAISPIIQIAATWVVFTGYHANKVERKNLELQQEQIYLKELEQLKNNFVSLISHDLKTPIAKITAIADRLLTQAPKQEEHFISDLKSLLNSAEELNQYIKSILQVLRVESRDFKLHKEVADINELIKQAVLQLNPLALEKQITIHEELEPMFSVEIDSTLIREVMVNLIENAIKYTPLKGYVVVRSFERANKVFIEVQDNGPGISKEEIPMLWGKFVRGKDQNLKTKGTGLGLYLVKYFIELHKGDVYMESDLGKGTKISLSLPLDEEVSTTCQT